MSGKFEASVRKHAEKTKRKLELAVREILTTFYTQVIVQSPEDTSYFIANWQTTIGAPADGVLSLFDKGGSMSVARMTQVISSFSLGQVAYLTNNVDYGIYLEQGNSMQAPFGMMKLALQNAPAIVSSVSAKYGAM